MQKLLEEQLTAAFIPPYLQILNESHLHGGGASRDPHKVRESHFNVVIVSEGFKGKRLIQRHQLVYAALGQTIKGVHALALHTYTPDEWSQREGEAPASPQCPKA